MCIKLWWIRNFQKILSKNEAEKLGLKYFRGVYGDEINFINCRSLWIDNKKRFYKVKELKKNES